MRHVLRAAIPLAIGISASFAWSLSVVADEPAKAEWPCVYRKVPVLSAATIWDGPEIKDTSSWRKDDAIRKLSQYVVSRRIKEADAEAAIKKYADGLPADTRDAKLTDLFAAILTRTNEDRKVVMSGIERFHKRQLERSKEIEKEGIELPPANDLGVTDDSSGPAGEISQLSSKEEKYKWEVRTFQEKQANIPIACEIPQLIDERAGALARAIRAEMKS
ncbi:hypothetical protein [Hyphomicrobium sp.]|uniref:hypothetical protein n=1 Tax=Hyphomicrobium sp. TaxID=82 RepID=UPI0025C1763D|nr:hypothetical protein [Hyphomicrobium sp.]